MPILTIMSSGAGRIARIVAGVGVIAAGLVVGGVGGYVLAAVGVVPLAARFPGFPAYASRTGRFLTVATPPTRHHRRKMHR